MKIRLFLAASALAMLVILTSSDAESALFTVANANATGPGSLAQAIEDANALPGPHEIAFAIPGSGIHKIDLSTQFLPVIRGSVVIDGYTQPGARPNTLSIGSDAVILIQLDGGGPSSINHRGLRIAGQDCVVRGLSFTGFSLSNDPGMGAAIEVLFSFEEPERRTRVEGNFIGLSPDGHVSGSYIGVISNWGDVIGGHTPEQRNVIAGNQIGILAQDLGLIAGNYIGLDPSGLRQGFGNRCGIAASILRLIGGSTPGAGNVISNNEIGIQADDSVTVQGNLIGPRADGSLGFGNQIGIVCRSRNTIGGLSSGQGNVIAFNRKGIVVGRESLLNLPFRPEGNRILSNLHYGNSVIDIDLGDDGPTSNDLQDADTGENLFQNFPIISEVTRATGNTTVRGGLNSKPVTSFTLQFFANGASRNTPQTLLGTRTVMTDGAGDARFEFTFPLATSPDQFITATATDPNGNTSEFFPPDGRVDFANLSARGFVGAGDDVLIGGIIRSGRPTTVLIRALGPSLPVSGALADPKLVVYGRDGGVLAQNDNWKTLQEQAIRATGLAPSNDLEAAVLTTAFRDPLRDDGTFTVHVSGADGGAGIGLVEVYAVGEGATELRNLSARGRVGTGDNVLIGGLIVKGDAAQEVIVRAIGPDLAQAGVPSPLQDPTLELRDAQGNLLGTNDNWRTNQEQEIIATGLAPNDERDAAIVAMLLPTAYTAIVRGKDGSVGVALVEFYKLDER
jgi:hypothetical protein